MDPFSITASIVTLIQVSAQVTVLVKQFRDEVNVVDTTVNGILNDVEGFQQVLQAMKETFAQEDIQADVQATGHVGSHWKNLARSLSDGESTLDQLRSLLTSVNKSTSFLDASRKQLRLKSALAQISGFRDQIQSYRAALQLSLSTIIVWNQVTLQKSTTKLPDKIMPNLNKLYDQIRNLGADLNAKIGKLENTVANQGFHAESELMSMTNLKECVESAADVVSTASTTLGPEGSERASKFGSDFGDVFKKDSNEAMQRWMSSNTVYEFDDVEAPTLDPSEASTGDATTVYESDSDSDIDHELVRALFYNGKKRKEQGDLHGAERHLRNCLTRFPSTTSYTSLASSQTSTATGVSKAELLELLTETYCLQGSWTQAKITMKEKLAITERQTGKKSERFLWDSFRLSEVLMNTKDYTEAQLHGRQSLRGFRKLREQGYVGYEKSLVLLIQICNEQGNLEDEEAYTALLGSHQASLNTQHPIHGTSTHILESSANLITSPSTASPSEGSSRRHSGHAVPAVQDTSKTPTPPGSQVTFPMLEARPYVAATGASLQNVSSKTSSPRPGFYGEQAAYAHGNSTAQEIVQDEPAPPIIAPASNIKGKGHLIGRLTPVPTLADINSNAFSSPPSSANFPLQGSPVQNVRSPVEASPSKIVASTINSKEAFANSAEFVPNLTLAEQNMLSGSTHAHDRDFPSYTKLLINLCQQELGKKPVFMIGRGREGYNCIVFADESRQKELAKVVNCKTKEEARHAAAARAYKTLVSLSTRSNHAPTVGKIAAHGPTNEVPASISSVQAHRPPMDRDVDPPAYTPKRGPSPLTSPTGFLQDIPEIMVSPTLDNATTRMALSMPQQSFAVRRAASDSRVPWQKNYNATQDLSPSQSWAAAPWGPQNSNAINEPLAHRRAASTSTRLPEWKAGDEKEFARFSGLGIAAPPAQGLQVSDSNRKRPTAQPSVTFDTIENALERPDHSNPDTTSPSTRSFSLFPSALAKTLSLQERRSKGDDTSLTKKKSFRFGLLSSSSSNGSSSKRKGSITTSPKSENDDAVQASKTTRSCPICSMSFHGYNDDESWSHVDRCLGRPSPPSTGTTYELPASNFFAAELPASIPTVNQAIEPPPTTPIQNPSALSDLHRAFSKRDLSADRFEVGDEVRLVLPTPMSPLSRFEMNPLQRQVLLLGDAQCGKTWLSSAWCNGSIPKHTPLAAMSFTKRMGSLEIVIQDHTGLYNQDQMRHASYGVVHAVLLCFDISSPESFDNVEHKWNHEADLYLKKVPKILVGCKKDINRGGSQTVWTRDAYKLTARINARAYFETSAVTMEGLDVLFNHVAQIAPR